MVNVSCSAKINLMLNIVGISNNMHLIDSLLIPFKICDIISISSRNDSNIRLQYTDKKLKFDNDTALKTAKEIQKKYHTKGVDILIDKSIPVKSGLGGSSADAAAVAKAMQKLYDLPEIDSGLLLRIGSDVPYMYKGGTQRVTGLGEKLEEITLPKMYKVVLIPYSGVQTGVCYNLYDEVGGEHTDINKFLKKPQNTTKFNNALERAACILNKDIILALQLLKDAGFCYGMSGSGSACFGIAYDKGEFKEKMAKLIKINHNRFVVLQEEKELI